MRLLIITQSVDTEDPVLGFFHRWIEEFSKRVEHVEVICLYEGPHDLPKNVCVRSLGKEHGRPRMGALAYAVRFYRALREAGAYDSVFVHMNPEYVVLAGAAWRLRGKRVVLWYAHKSIPLSLRLAALFVHRILTASPQSLRLKTKKKIVLGHGIDMDAFPPVLPPESVTPLSLLTVGRVSPQKRLEVLVRALPIIARTGTDVRMRIAGGPATHSDESYADRLRIEAQNTSCPVQFLGPTRRDHLPGLFAESHLFVHASATGSLDKAVLEPLACGVPVVTANEDLANVACPAIFSAEPSPESFATRVREAAERKIFLEPSVREAGREYVRANHSLSALIPRILAELGEAS